MRRSNGNVLLLLFTSSALLLSACQTGAVLPATSAPLTVLGTVDAASADIVAAQIVLKRGKHVVEATVPVHQSEFQGVLQVPLGQWELTVYLVDAEGKVLYQSKPQSTEISYGTGSTVKLVLRPAASTVHITLDLDNYIFRNLALRARIYFNDQLYEVVRPNAETPFETQLEISPGSYEFKVELYTESFHIGNRLGPGIWQVIHIGENEELFLTWKPESEELVITGRVETLLPAPTGVTVTGDSSQIEISWEPVNHWNLQGYIVLAQTNPLERFQVLTSSSHGITSIIHAPDSESFSSTVTYVVAAVSRYGLVGYYSEPRVWSP